jgi:membrane protein DedA with SNARE-associated domain
MTETLPFFPQAVADWLPGATAMGVFLATFILEDVAAVGGGLLLAADKLTWPAAFTACFLGIWFGDVGLYALARIGGRRWFERSRFRKFSAAVATSEHWFGKRGTLLLIFSRVVPGARLPTYLAAGFLRAPLPGFLLVTGVASCLWTLLILRLTELFGARLLDELRAYKHSGLLLLGGVVALIGLLQLFRRYALRFDFGKLARLRHWEFWPGWLFYPPVVLYCAWLAVKYRGLSVATAANPGIFSGGLVGESKFATLQDLMATSPKFTATAALVEGSTLAERQASLAAIRDRLQIDFPFILKPDMGQRGAGVKLIRTAAQAEAYLRQTTAPLLVQRYAAGPHEVGIFYYRFPHETRGRIFSLTEKVFPTVTGDGTATLAELIWRDARARFVADTYLRRLGPRQHEVPAAGTTVKLVEAGNHAQGCIFCDGVRLITPALTEQIDAISQKLTGFFIGRYDIRYATEADLAAGNNFSIIELNGAAAEAASIYDARYSVFTAYRTLFRQWELVFAIGAANRRRGCVPTPLREVWQKWREYSRLAATYPAAD